MEVSIQLDYGTTFTQWDKGRYLYIIGYDQSADVKVHYTTSASGAAFVVLPTWDPVVSMWKAGVPNLILTEGKAVNVYLYDEDLEVTGTVYKHIVPVDPKDKPEDYIYDSYEDNVLIWPYEENIEDILRREQERISAEESRTQSQEAYARAEEIRNSQETNRINAESQRIQNEKDRQRLMSELQNDVNLFKDIQREIISARGDYDTLQERLDQIDNTEAVVNAHIDDDGSLIIEYADGHAVNIGQIPVGAGAGQQIIDIKKTSGDGSPGSLDTYTIYLDTGDTYQFTVQNGKDGATGSPGKDGDKGESGVFIGEKDPGESYDVWIDTDGESEVGIKGITFTPHVDANGTLSWTNDSEEEIPNPDPVNIKGPKGSTYTPAVSWSGDLSWSNDGNLPNPSTVNIKGDSGVYIGPDTPPNNYDVWIDPSSQADTNITGTTFTPSVDDEGNLSWTNDGNLLNPESKNIRGPIGYTFTPSMSSEGDLSWSNNGGLDNPPVVNLRGVSGVFVGSSEPASEEYDVWVSPEGEVSNLKGATFTPHVSETGDLSWTNDQGLINPPTVNIRGSDGENGVTYFPSISSVGVISWTNNGGLPNPAPFVVKGSDGRDGRDGIIYVPSVSDEGILIWHNDKGMPNPDPVDIRGPIGYTFTPTVDSDGNISWTNDGSLQNPTTVNIKGPQGIAGVIFTPAVDDAGNLSWSNNGGLANPQTINIRGPVGPSGGGDADTLDGHDSTYYATSTHDHDDATQTAHGYLSVNDKVKLDTMSKSGAQDVGTGASPTFGTVTADVVIGAVYM